MDHSGCPVCGRRDNPYRCLNCLKVAYCSVGHQKHDWKSHKKCCSCFVVRVKIPLDEDLVIAGDPNEILVFPDSTQVDWEFSKNLEFGALVFTEMDAQLLAIFEPEDLERDVSNGLKLPMKIVSRRFPYTQSDSPNCRIITSGGEFSEDFEPSEELKRGRVMVRTSKAVKTRDVVTVGGFGDRKMWMWIQSKSDAERVQTVCEMRDFFSNHRNKNGCCIPISQFFDWNIQFQFLDPEVENKGGKEDV